MSQLRRYWNNESESVVLDALSRIARVLKVKPGDLIVEDDTSTEEKS